MITPWRKNQLLDSYAMVLLIELDFLDFNNTMVQSSKKSDSTMVILKSENPTRYTTPWRKSQVIYFCVMVLFSIFNYEVWSYETS